ncbi:MAG: thiamine diphosphokinase [Chloroflexi bacterium]|nr:thiamine diphosphokinase [Chloroflexota bacterium]
MSRRHVVVLADGDPPARDALDAAWPGWSDGIEVVIAADGGARLAATLGFRIDHWVGDGDSLGADGVAALRGAGIETDLVEAAKDESDTELALAAAARVPGVGRITILGALGGRRVDHAIANLGLLALPVADDLDVAIVDPGSRIRLLSGGPDGAGLSLAGRPGDLVSLLPMDDVDGVTTEGLRYPLRDEPLRVGPARGLSNVRERADAAVRIQTGRLLVVEVPATLQR